jgi:1-phosphofructokinase family hexose kinase
MIVCVSGNPSVDKLFEVDSLAPGEIHRPRSFLALAGGKGIHVAQVTTELGGDAMVTGILAGHAGQWIAEQLAAEGVPAQFVWGYGETRSSLSVADRATGKLTEFYEDGVPASPAEWASLTEAVRELITAARWLVLAGSVPVQAGVDGYPELIGIAHDAGVPVALDSRGESLAGAIGTGPQLVKINASEAQELLGHPLEDIAAARAAAIEIRSRAGGEGHAVVITLGERGMVLATPDGDAWHGSVASRGSYPVGSGDAFLAGLLTALTAGESWQQSAALGLGAAAANAELPGAGRLDPQRARQLATQAEIRRLD